MLGRNHIFISHSSQNKDIAEQLCVFITGIGVDKQKIFCSSIIGQGIDNGKKLNETIANTINKSKLLIFLISHDFIASSYCMEELGVGWFLNQSGKANCFYLVLPDVTLAELQGFVNSKINKFSFIDDDHKDDFGLFAENLCNIINIKLPKHSELLNLENTFFSAIKSSLKNIIELKEQKIEEEKKKESEIERLKESVNEQQKIIINLNNELAQINKENEKELLLNEYNTIRDRFIYLGFGTGITQESILAISKGFWTDMINRYIELEESLEIKDEEKSECMELLLAILLSTFGEEELAFEHFKLYLTNEDIGVYTNDFDNVKIPFEKYLDEIIEILRKKLKKEPRGLARDSYKNTIDKLIEKYGKKE